MLAAKDAEGEHPERRPQERAPRAPRRPRSPSRRTEGTQGTGCRAGTDDNRGTEGTGTPEGNTADTCVDPHPPPTPSCIGNTSGSRSTIRKLRCDGSRACSNE